MLSIDATTAGSSCAIVIVEQTAQTNAAFGSTGTWCRSPVPFGVTPVTETGVYGSVICADQLDFIFHYRRLHSFRDLPVNWDAYGADPPNEHVLKTAHSVLCELMNMGFSPQAVVPSVEGGVGFAFRRGSFYGDIECLNDGHVLAVISDGRQQPFAWEIEPTNIGFQHAIRRIRDHLAR